MRILVTGGRDRADRDMIWRELDLTAAGHTRVTIVHGACPTGADMWVSAWCQQHPGATEERHPADWDRHGKAAGTVRNATMVALGADVCLAFPAPTSRGTWDCVRKARAAGIRIEIHTGSGETTSATQT